MTLAQILAIIPASATNTRAAITQIARLWPEVLNNWTPERVRGWATDLKAGRADDDLRDDLFLYTVGAERIAETLGVTVGTANEIILGANEGGMNLAQALQLPKVRRHLADANQQPPPNPPPPPPDPVVPPPPPPPPVPVPTPINWRARAAALYPFLPPSLLDIFAEKWADSGDVNLALAEMRADPQYDSFFPGIKREDGSLRLTEAEYLARIDGYNMALSQFGLNSSIFSNHFVGMIEGELSPSELTSRLGAAYDQIVTAMPDVKQYYASNFGVELTDEAIFASFIDPEIGTAILNNRIAVSQIGGMGAAFGFQLDLAFAERIRQRGVGGQANELFAEAAYQIPILNTLAQRFDTADPTVDFSEYAEASIFQDPAALRRFRRYGKAETASFTESTGRVATQQDFAVTGLSPR